MDNDDLKPDDSNALSSTDRSSDPPSESTSNRASVDSENEPNSSANHFHLPLWTKGALVIVVLGLASVGYFSDTFLHLRSPLQIAKSSGNSTSEPDPEEVAKRTLVPDFILTDADKKQQKLSDFRGNVVILSFWASWCTPCLVELPTFAQIESRLRDRGLRVLAINVDEGDEGKVFAKDFWAKEKFDFPSFFDTDKHLQQQFGVDILPSNFVIDRQGRLAFSGFGANDWGNSQTKDFIESLLQESAQNPGQSPGGTPGETTRDATAGAATDSAAESVK